MRKENNKTTDNVLASHTNVNPYTIYYISHGGKEQASNETTASVDSPGTVIFIINAVRFSPEPHDPRKNRYGVGSVVGGPAVSVLGTTPPNTRRATFLVVSDMERVIT